MQSTAERGNASTGNLQERARRASFILHATGSAVALPLPLLLLLPPQGCPIICLRRRLRLGCSWGLLAGRLLALTFTPLESLLKVLSLNVHWLLRQGAIAAVYHIPATPGASGRA